MHPFRKKTPKRRADRAECIHYEAYKVTLREDFNNRCGYCDDTDFFRIRNFTIDHFVPRNPKDFKHDIKPNYYYNLVYACYYCNSAKSNKWWTNDVTVTHDGERGFLDPTFDDYTELFKRDVRGRIQSNGINDLLAQFIIKELNLWLEVHEITWKLERLKELSEEIRGQIEEETNERVKAELQKQYDEIRIGVAELYDSLFVPNE